MVDCNSLEIRRNEHFCKRRFYVIFQEPIRLCSLPLWGVKKAVFFILHSLFYILYSSFFILHSLHPLVINPAFLFLSYFIRGTDFVMGAFCIFMQYVGGRMGQAPEWSARDLSSGHEVRCPEVSPSPLKWSRADLSRGHGLKGRKKAIFTRFFRPENV